MELQGHISSHILSEIELLADDIGIIHNGILIEENSLAELQQKNTKYIQLQVSDPAKATLLLERKFQVNQYSVQDNDMLRIYDTSLDLAEINKALMLEDISVMGSQLCNDTLEDYFKKITGKPFRFPSGKRKGCFHVIWSIVYLLGYTDQPAAQTSNSIFNSGKPNPLI